MLAKLKAHKWIVAGALFVFAALGGATQFGLISLGDDSALCAGCVSTGTVKTNVTLAATATRTPTATPTPSGPSVHTSTPEQSLSWTQVEPASSSYGSLYIRASDTDIWRRAFTNDAWQAWEHIPYGFSSAPAGVYGWSAGDYVFARGNNNAMYYRKRYYDYPSYSYAWTEWQGLGGVKTSGPSGIYSDGVYTFARGTDNQYYYRFLDDPWADTDTWTNWQAIGGNWNSAPSVAVGDGGWGPTGVYVFGRGMDNALYMRWGGHAEGWLNPWKNLGGNITSAPAAVRDRSGFFYVFAKGSDNNLSYRQCTSACWQEWNWDVWRSISGPNGATINSAPAASVWGVSTAPTADRGVLVSVRGADNAIWTNLLRTGQSVTAWRGWEKLP